MNIIETALKDAILIINAYTNNEGYIPKEVAEEFERFKKYINVINSVSRINKREGKWTTLYPKVT